MTLILVDDLLGSTITPFVITKSDESELTLYQKDLPAGAVLDFVEKEEGVERNAALLVLMAQAVCQEDGTPVFTSDEHMDRLREMPVRIFEQISTAVVAAAGIGADEEDEEEKNS